MSDKRPADPSRKPTAPDAGRQKRLEELTAALAAGELRFYQLPQDLTADEAAAVRRRALERIARVSLSDLGTYSLDAERAASRHCENFLGVAQVPMGVVGPVTVRGRFTDGDVYVPLSTTEGALLASINRGCAAIRKAGGARVWVEDVGMTRAPVFRTTGLEQTQELLAWVSQHEEEIRQLCQGTSRYLRLLDIRPFAFGTTVFLRFRFSSGDAMGMNMATIACDRVVSQLIEPATGVECIALSGNYCVDKKPASINFQEGRGKRIHAEVLLEAPVLARYLKTNARSLVEVQYRKNLLGSIAAGSQGHNAHIANIAAAFFLATGQDLAHVVGASMGITSLEVRDEDSVYASILLPDLPLGAIGGGTVLATQRQALDLLGVHPDPERPGSAVMRLAEIFGATVLAGELSLLSAFTSQDLASAHERLARGKQVETGLRSSPATVGAGAGDAELPAAAGKNASAAAAGSRSVAYSTPGKLILMGEHAVVYGRPALVTALDMRLKARLSPRAADDGESLRLDLPQVELTEEVGWDEVREYADGARRRWESYHENPTSAAFSRVRGGDPAHVVKVALGEGARRAAALGVAVEELPPFSLRIQSALPLGAGFGSSAATAVAVLSALFDYAGCPVDAEEIHRVSLEAERRQHGQPSGVDNAAVLHGGLIWARRDVSGGVKIENLESGSPLLGRLRIFNSGSPPEPTGAVVGAVRERVDADPLAHEELFDRMERATWGLRQELARQRENPLKVVALFRQYQACLEQLGVVPEATRELVRQIEARGGAAKISGAGSLGGPGAGSLLVYHPAAGEIESWGFLGDLPAYPVHLGAEGARLEQLG